MKKNVLLLVFATGILAVSCNQVAQKAEDELNNAKNQANEKVQNVIDELGLVYVEEGAQDVITYQEVYDAQQAWCDGLVRIGKLKSDGGDYRKFTEDFISEAFHYVFGNVFFNPSLAFGQQTFRVDKKGAISYFIGGDKDYPNDKGFALQPWVKARFDNLGEKNEGIQIYGSVAITMGNVWVTDNQGNEVMVDKTWVFKKGKDGKLRIIVHKSSLPFNPST